MRKWRLWHGKKFYKANKNSLVPFDESASRPVLVELPALVTVVADKPHEHLIDELLDLARCGRHVAENGEALRRLATILESEGRTSLAEAVRTILENPGARNENAERFVRARAERNRERLRKKTGREGGAARQGGDDGW